MKPLFYRWQPKTARSIVIYEIGITFSVNLLVSLNNIILFCHFINKTNYQYLYNDRRKSRSFLNEGQRSEQISIFSFSASSTFIFVL